ncbi:MAG: SlyX family protein [Alphaproteobacteria bacterium]
MTDKIIDIETTLAHHEQKIDELNEVITDQWKEIDALKRALERAIDKIDQIEFDNKEEDGKNPSSIELARQAKPPHY